MSVVSDNPPYEKDLQTDSEHEILLCPTEKADVLRKSFIPGIACMSAAQ